jgi:hypothetical protein
MYLMYPCPFSKAKQNKKLNYLDFSEGSSDTIIKNETRQHKELSVFKTSI